MPAAGPGRLLQGQNRLCVCVCVFPFVRLLWVFFFPFFLFYYFLIFIFLAMRQQLDGSGVCGSPPERRVPAATPITLQRTKDDRRV